MSITFVHTADWQLGKPFARVTDSGKRARLQSVRVEAIRRIGNLVREQDAAFVLVAGDLFDSNSPEKGLVSQACAAIGKLAVPVVVIPGNHDFGGPGSVWDQEFFKGEQASLAPNLQVLLASEPVDIGPAVVLPCPLLRRHQATDPTAWLRDPEVWNGLPSDKPRLVLAHGTVLNFDAPDPDDEEAAGGGVNHLDLDRLPYKEFDYAALGDWHGTLQVNDKAWYAGTPEPDRFRRGDTNDPGNVLVVQAERGQAPRVESVRTGTLDWHEIEFEFHRDEDLEVLQSRFDEVIGNRVDEDLLLLKLSGSLGIAATQRLDALIDTWESRLVRLKLKRNTRVMPSEEEMVALAERAGDPLISRVAARLQEKAGREGPDGEVARTALRQLFEACETA